MKHIKKCLALVLAVAMVVGMAVTAFAADETTYTITVKRDTTDKVAHTYGAYQLFKGDLDESGNTKILSNIQWGDSIDTSKTAALITAINAAMGTSLAADASAADVAKAISDKNYTTDSDGAKALAEAFSTALGTAKATGTLAANADSVEITVPAGYYLVKDDADVSGEGAKTRYILEVVSNVTAAEKANVPTVEKKVKEKNDTTDTTTDWQDAADYDIGDAIEYKITGTLPSDFADYKTYKTYTFTDTLSEGLTITDEQKAGIKVIIGENGTDITDNFNISVADNVLTVSLKSDKDLKTIDGITASSKIVVTYSATLNDEAKIGSEGNPNTVKLDFSNNPNSGGDGDKGTTPEDKVTVFTYTIEANKVGEDGKTPLEGAGFTLYKKVNGTYTPVGDEITGVTTFTFSGVDAGEYKLVETTVPAGYNKADDIEFTVTATYDTEADDPQLKTLTVTPETAEFTVTTTTKEDGTHITTDGVATTTIVNEKGSTLPSTGGMGTTIFYVLGSILVIGAGVVLVTRKRMGAGK